MYIDTHQKVSAEHLRRDAFLYVSALIRKGPSVSQNHSPPSFPAVTSSVCVSAANVVQAELMPRRALQRRNVNVLVVATRVV